MITDSMALKSIRKNKPSKKIRAQIISTLRQVLANLCKRGNPHVQKARKEIEAKLK